MVILVRDRIRVRISTRYVGEMNQNRAERRHEDEEITNQNRRGTEPFARVLLLQRFNPRVAYAKSVIGKTISSHVRSITKSRSRKFFKFERIEDSPRQMASLLALLQKLPPDSMNPSSRGNEGTSKRAP